MEDVFLLIILGSNVGLIAAAGVQLCRGARMSRRLCMGLLLAASVSQVILANYVVAGSRYVHGLGKFPPTLTLIAELAVAVMAFPVGLRFWRWLETEKKVPHR